MNREEFLTKLFSLYATTFNRGNGQAWTDAYKQVLSPDIDYDQLYDYMLSNYDEGGAPKPAWLKKNAVYIQKEQEKKPVEFPTIIGYKKGHGCMDFGMENTDYVKHIEFFQKRGISIVKVKYCDKNCQRCNYNHVCMTSKELAQCK